MTTMIKLKNFSLRKPEIKKVSVKKCLLGQLTTINGFRQFVYMRYSICYWIWLSIILSNFFGTLAFLVIAKQRLNSDQIVTKIYSDYPVRNVPFPAVSICNFNLVSERQTKTILKILKDYGKAKEAPSFFRDLPALRDFRVRRVAILNNTKLMRVLNTHYFDVETIMGDVHQNCEDLLLYCEFNNKRKSCQEIFRLVLTMEGHCCTFNYVAINEDDYSLLPEDTDFEYYYDQGSESQEATRIITTAQSGRTSGLKVVFNVEPSDYPSYAAVGSYGAKIMISDPNDYPETSVLYRSLHIGESLDLKVAPLVFQSDSNLRELPANRRGLGCAFSDEVDLLNTNRYSYETCKTECKMANYVKVCGCIPYKYPNVNHLKVCEFEDLPCLHNVTVYQANWFEQCNPPCFLECRDKTYTMTSDRVPFLSVEWPDDVTKNRNISELASLQVYFVTPACNCFRQSLLMDFNTVIATYGGVFSLSFGGSLITWFEIVYLLVTWCIKKVTGSVYNRNGFITK